MWLRKTTVFFDWCLWLSFPASDVEDQDTVITSEACDRQFGPIGAEPVQGAQEKSEQVHVALLALTESESFDAVLGVAPCVETVGPSLASSDSRSIQTGRPSRRT